MRPTFCIRRNSSPCLHLCLFYHLYNGRALWICLCLFNTFPAIWRIPRPWQFQSLQTTKPLGLRMTHLRERKARWQTGLFIQFRNQEFSKLPYSGQYLKNVASEGKTSASSLQRAYLGQTLTGSSNRIYCIAQVLKVTSASEENT